MRSQNPAPMMTIRPLPNYEDLKALGGEPKLIEMGPRNIHAYALRGKYIGMFDMTGYGGNDAKENNENAERDGTGSGEGSPDGEV